MSEKPPQKSPHFPDAFYRVSVKGVCVREGKLLMTRDFTNPNHLKEGEWELPGGGLDFGENITDALKREIREEMGLNPTWVAEKPAYVWAADHGSGRGMEWFYVLVLVYQFEVENLDFIPSEECREIRFFTLEEIRTARSEVALQLLPLLDLFNPKDFETLEIK